MANLSEVLGLGLKISDTILKKKTNHHRISAKYIFFLIFKPREQTCLNQQLTSDKPREQQYLLQQVGAS